MTLLQEPMPPMPPEMPSPEMVVSGTLHDMAVVVLLLGAGLMFAALIWPRATAQAGVGSIAAGMTVTLVWELAGLRSGAPPLGLQTIYPALLASVGTLVVMSVGPTSRSRVPDQPRS